MPRPHLHERLLQLIWEKQYVDPDRLVTTDGRPVEVCQPGSVSLDSGPDIRGARVRIGGVLYAGDVELHRNAEEWDLHGHSSDPRYNGVILHVVLHNPRRPRNATTLLGRTLPVLVLGRALIGPLEELRADLLFDERDLLTGRVLCSNLNDHVPASVLIDMLERLALERMEIKLRRFEERLNELARTSTQTLREPPARRPAHDREHPDIPASYAEPASLELSRREIWEQLLYEGLMEGLGYSRNRTPFIRLSREVPLELIRRLTYDDVSTESLLFGVAGLLPELDSLDDTESRAYVHSLRSEWKEQRRIYRGEILTRGDWTLSPTRPFNTPFVRLVAARDIARRFIDDDLFRTITTVIKRSGIAMRRELHRTLLVDPGQFWERRVSFSRIVPMPVQPLGEDRRNDLIVNVIAPVFLLYARLFHDADVREAVVSMLRSYPPSQPNVVTRRMRTHVFRQRVPLDSALRQQAAVQLFNYYCKEGRCAECEVGRRIWGE